MAADQKLAQDLTARRSKAELDRELMLEEQSFLAGAGTGDGTNGAPGVDIVSRVNALAADFMSQGMSPDQSYSKALQAIELDGRANNYI